MEILSDVAGSASEAQNAVPLAAEGPGIDRVPPVAPPVAPPAAPAASTAPRTKRTSLQSAQHKLLMAENKVAKLRRCHVLAAEAAVAATVKRDIDRYEKKAQKMQAAVETWDLQVDAARSALEVLQARAAAAEEAERARKEASRERSDNMTVDGRQLLVRTRLSFEHQFTGKTNTNDSVWEHVKAKFEECVRDGQAAESDIRPLGSLKSKYSHELGAFKQWVALRHMKCVSGTPAEEIEALDQLKTCTTDIFWDHNIQNRPAVLPPYSINGGNAARGGQVNLFIDESNSRGALPCADGEEMCDELHDDYDENAPPQEQLSPLLNEPDENFDPHAPILAHDARGKDAVPAAAGTGGHGTKRGPRVLNLGGSSARKRPAGTPRTGSAAAGTAQVGAEIREFRVENAQLQKFLAVEMREHENKAAAEQRALDKEAAAELRAHELKVAAERRAHELDLVKATAMANAPKTVEQQLLELKGLLEKGLVDQEHHDKLKMKCLETAF